MPCSRRIPIRHAQGVNAAQRPWLYSIAFDEIPKWGAMLHLAERRGRC